MVRRLPIRFIGECSGYFRCLCVVYWFMHAFVHQNVIIEKAHLDDLNVYLDTLDTEVFL